PVRRGWYPKRSRPWHWRRGPGPFAARPRREASWRDRRNRALRGTGRCSRLPRSAPGLVATARSAACFPDCFDGPNRRCRPRPAEPGRRGPASTPAQIACQALFHESARQASSFTSWSFVIRSAGDQWLMELRLAQPRPIFHASFYMALLLWKTSLCGEPACVSPRRIFSEFSVLRFLRGLTHPGSPANLLYRATWP